MAKKIKRFTIKIFCQSYQTQLYKYSKEGPGNLVKCFVSSILEDNTNGDCKCNSCGQEFARPIVIKGRNAHKIIKGKIYIKGSTGKK